MMQTINSLAVKQPLPPLTIHTCIEANGCTRPLAALISCAPGAKKSSSWGIGSVHREGNSNEITNTKQSYYTDRI